MFDPRDLASAMRKLRGKRPQNVLARSVGISPETWCKWEQGGTTPRSLVPIAAALGCTPERLHEVMEEQRREREQARPRHPAPAHLVQETDRLLQKVDHQLDSLIESKNALLRMREQLVTPEG